MKPKKKSLQSFGGQPPEVGRPKNMPTPGFGEKHAGQEHQNEVPGKRPRTQHEANLFQELRAFTAEKKPMHPFAEKVREELRFDETISKHAFVLRAYAHGYWTAVHNEKSPAGRWFSLVDRVHGKQFQNNIPWRKLDPVIMQKHGVVVKNPSALNNAAYRMYARVAAQVSGLLNEWARTGKIELIRPPIRGAAVLIKKIGKE